MHILPAYGRVYKNKKEFLDDFNAGKDFVILDGMRETYGSIKELPENGFYQIRYGKNLRSTTCIKIKDGKAK